MQGTFSDKPICGKHYRPGTSKLCSAFSECCKSTPEVASHKKAKPVRSLAFSAADEVCETSLAPIFLANLGDPDFTEKVNKIKLKCETERTEAEAEKSVGSGVKSLLTQMMGAVSHGGNKPKNKHDWNLWKKISIAIESGAAETMIPHTLVTEYAISPSDKSRAGVW